VSINPPLYTESPLLYQKVNAPEFVNKRLLIITYFNMGYSVAYMSTQLSVTEKYCDKIIRMFQTYGLKALLKRDFGLRQKKEQKKLNNYEISLLHSLVRHSPPKNYKKWTYNYLTEIINQSALFENEIGLCTLRSIMISKGIDLNAWKHQILDINDVHYQTITHLVNILDTIVSKAINDYELDIALTENIIKDLLSDQKAVTIFNVFVSYKKHYNLPKLSIYKFSKLLKNQFPRWEYYKEESHKNQNIVEKKITLSKTEVDTLTKISENPDVPRLSRMRAIICLELNKETNVKEIEERTKVSKSMIYRVYHRYQEAGIQCITLKKRVNKSNHGPYVTKSVKKYPHLVSDIQALVSVPPSHKSKWTIEEITKELRNRNYSISTTSVAKLIQYHRITY